MEEKKFDKDINVHSKDDTEINVGMTDEEIVKVLEERKSIIDREFERTGTPINFMMIPVDAMVIEDTIYLIHRLQSENAEQKAEIERLTEERENMQAEIMRFEDMKFTREHCDLYAENEWLKASIRQSLNSTAQNALEEFICRLVNLCLVSTKSDLYVEMLEAKDDLLKEKYGVE